MRKNRQVRLDQRDIRNRQHRRERQNVHGCVAILLPIAILSGCSAHPSGGLLLVSPDSHVTLTVAIDGVSTEIENVWATLTQIVPADACTQASRLVLHNANTAANISFEAIFPDPLSTGSTAEVASLPFDGDRTPTLFLIRGDPPAEGDESSVTTGGSVTFTADAAWEVFELAFEGTRLCPAGQLSLDDLLGINPESCSEADIVIALSGNIGQGSCTDGFGGSGVLCAPSANHFQDESWSCASESDRTGP